ncbi:hypothetical protein BLS_000770 [Venturia inaequalis]|uniref:AA1-like domain-containing protein n=1 Tax=Venturia inaequalis TaxID=5025 RepID=A0A8H3UBJ0_VENIN|nr:hypothetical protein BLS_000770 [Venturia inaequalis]KAE9966628.1 hypothetical protein EG327_011775 [Venturia inaequalis]KAE9969695.1 hypothetical protein EG328_006710 [Venturia inaequalis]RDI85131.1 5'-3' exoribonuclease 1 [Venturia inaequalis]
MVSFTTLFATVAATASIVAASPFTRPDPPTTSACGGSNDEVLKITDFFSRKYDGINIATLGFNISATNGGELNFRCAPYDPAIDATAAQFEDKRVYFCAKDSSFSFSFENAANQLYLWQTIVTDTNILVGNGTIPNYCHAGGSSQTDMVCQQVADVNITMVQSA